jgi:hypothetical protein
MVIDQDTDLLTRLSLTLGQVRAEYSSDDDIFRMFSTPVYWSELVGPRPCFLVGGRGTGKTTTLRAMGYQGQARSAGADPAKWRMVGAYWRIESNITMAFQGSRLAEYRWTSAFAHYVNLRLVQLILDYSSWSEHPVELSERISAESLELTCIALHLDQVDSLDQLARQVRRAIAALESYLNGAPSHLEEMPLSALGAPVRYLLGGLSPTLLPAGVPFAFCLDEYENLLPYQQRVINTLIKHAGDSPYTFKVGVRDTTESDRSTLVDRQPLVDPADFTTINVVSQLRDQSFTKFARNVCAKRIVDASGWAGSLDDLFPSLSIDEETVLLGGGKRIAATRQQLELQDASRSELQFFDDLPPSSAALVSYWTETEGERSLDVLRSAIANPVAWKTRVGNYGYAMLFTLREGLRGTRKYYTGWSLLCQLADGNIRYLLRLVYEALRLHVAEAGSISPVSFEHQTQGAQKVGETSLRELQAQSRRGVDIMRIALSLGRIFNVYATDARGHTPEVNQFRVDYSRSTTDPDEVKDLLQECVSYGALVPFAGNKEGRVTAGTKEFDYRLHPIFAPYFVFSHRRKRRLTVYGDEVIALSTASAARTITTILSRRGSRQLAPLPEQLEFYSDFLSDAE